jgi:DNA-3-methyladenine glycosylase II
MTLRRSTRNSTKTEAADPETKIQNGVANADPKKPATATKKRKSRAAVAFATSMQDALNPDKLPSLTDATKKSDAQFAVPGLPTTPKSKRRKLVSDSPSMPPPFTPTPSGVGLITAPSHGHPLENLGNEPVRPAEPHSTNAPLSTPGGSRVVAYASSPVQPHPSSHEDNQSPNKKRKAKETAPPDVGALRPPTSTTDTLLNDACAHLCSVDPHMRVLTEQHHCKIFSPEGLQEVVDPFTALASGIIGQQVRHTSPHHVPLCTLYPLLLNSTWLHRGSSRVVT